MSVVLLTVPEAAQQLGCSENHTYRLISDGALRAVDIARPGSRKSKTRIRMDDLAAFIDAHTRQTSGARTA